MKEIVHQGFALRLSHRIPIQTASRREPSHVFLAVAGRQLPPRIAFGGEVRKDAPLALGWQLFHQLHHLFVGQR